MRLLFAIAARRHRLLVSALMGAAVAIPATWSQGHAQAGASGILRWTPEAATSSSILQIQDKKRRKEKKGKRGEGKAAKCHERCLLKNNPAACQSRCQIGGKADD